MGDASAEQTSAVAWRMGGHASAVCRFAASGARCPLGDGPVARAAKQPRGDVGNRAGDAARRLETVHMKPATGAHAGTGSWLVQRATAEVLAVALPGLMAHFLLALPVVFSGWQGLFAPHWVRVLLLLTALALALHAWVGVRDIFMDYIHFTSLRLALYLAVIVILAGSVVWLAAVQWGLACFC